MTRALIGLVVVLHLYIAWFEMFAWTDVGPDVFSTFDPEIFAETTDIAANQGVYNLFLAAGLVWSLVIRDQLWSFRVALCFLGFVAIAGVTASVTIAFSSGLPQLVLAVVAIVATAINHRAAANLSG